MGASPCSRKSPRGASGGPCPQEDPLPSLPRRVADAWVPQPAGLPQARGLPHSRQEGPEGLPGGSTCQGLTHFPSWPPPAPRDHSTPKLVVQGLQPMTSGPDLVGPELQPETDPCGWHPSCQLLSSARRRQHLDPAPSRLTFPDARSLLLFLSAMPPVSRAPAFQNVASPVRACPSPGPGSFSLGPREPWHTWPGQRPAQGHPQCQPPTTARKGKQ